MRPPRIAILDYGVGNLLSVKKGIEAVGGQSVVTPDVREALELDATILPGVGAFKPAVHVLEPHERRLEEALNRGIWLFGICLGMQLFFESSAEGGRTRGLGLIPGEVIELPVTVKRPHMGWNTITNVKKHPLFEGIPDDSFFYFVHSYYGKPAQSELAMATSDYGVEFPSVVASDRILGTQFHPEKSGKQGLRMLGNLVGMIQEAM